MALLAVVPDRISGPVPVERRLLHRLCRFSAEELAARQVVSPVQLRNALRSYLPAAHASLDGVGLLVGGKIVLQRVTKADVVYGSRFLGGPHRVLLFWQYVAIGA